MEEFENAKISFSKMCEDWLSYEKPRIKESTYSNYNFKINRYLKEYFNGMMLYDFKTCNVNEYVEHLQKRLESKTIKDIITVLKSILRYSERKYDLDFKLDLISSPLLNQTEIVVFNDKERKKLEKYLLESEDIKTLGILISLYTGLRIGEVCALKWSDFDFENNLLNVNYTVQRIYLGKKNTKLTLTSPKTKKSIRKIPLGKTLITKLKPISKKYDKDDFVITGVAEKFVEPLGYRYTYKKILKECEIEYKKYHCLRHTFATRCIAIGMDIKSLSEILGHANVNITLNIYVHSSYELKKKFMDKL